MKKMSFKSIFNWLYGATLDRAMSVQQPTNIQRISNLSPTVSTVKVAQKSRISPILPLFATVLMLILGVGNAWGAWVGPSGETSGSGTQKDGVWYVLYEKDQIKIDIYQTKTRTLLGPGAQLSFDATKDYAGTGNLTVTDNTGHQYYKGNPGKGFWGTDDEPLGPYSISNVQSVNTLSLNGGKTLAKYVKKLRVTMAQYIDNPTGGDLVAKDGFAGALNFGTGKVDDANTTKTFTIAWCNVPAMTYSVTGTGADKISVSISPNSEAGKFNTATISVTYKRDAASILDATLNIADTYGSYSKNISLTGSTTRYDQTLAWNNPGDIVLTMRVGAEQTLSASSAYSGGATGAAITYTSSDPDVLSYNTSTGKIEANAVGSATITASQSGTYKFNAAESIVTGTFVISDKQTSIFTPAWSDPESTKELKVGESVTMTVANVSNGLDGNFTAVSDGDGVLHFSRVGNTITITAYSEGDVNAVFTQEENEDIFAASATYSFSVTKNAPTITVPENQSLLVDGSFIASALDYTNTSGLVPDSGAIGHDFYYVIEHLQSTSVNKSDAVITFNPSTKEIVAQNAGTATITISQKATREYSELSRSFTITVHKYNSVFANVADLNVKVDENVTSAYTLTYTKPNDAYIGADNHSAGIPGLNEASGDFYYTLAQEVTTENTAGSDQPTWAITYDAASKTATGKNAGTGTIHLYQKETYKYNAADEDFDVIVSKHVPTFTWSNAIVYYNRSIANFCTSNQSATSITRTSSDEEVATLSGSTLTAYNKAGTARITMTQAENYYWAEHTEYRDITPEKVSNHVPFAYTSEMVGNSSITPAMEDYNKWEDNGVALYTAFWDDKWIVIHFEGIPDKVQFQYKTNHNANTDCDWYIKESTDGTNWPNENAWSDERSSSTLSDVTSVQLKPESRYIKMCYSGNNWGLIQNISFTELKYFKTDSTAFDFKTQIKNADVPSKSFKFKHANAGYTVTATSNDSHYKLSLNNSDFYSSIIIPNTGGDKMDSSVVYVKYYPSIAGDVEETHNATITFSDALSNSATVSLTGKTQAKLATHLEYIGSDSYSVNADNIAATTLFEVRDANGNVVPGAVIALSKNETSAIDIVSDDKVVDFKCGGSATITAHYAGDNTTYQAASDLEQAITITRLADVLSFNDAKASMVVGEELDITGWVSALSESSITVSSLTSSYLVLEGNTLRAVGKGQGKLQAVSAGNCTYNSGTKTLDILVRNPNDPCKHPLLYNSGTLSVGNNGGDNNKILPIDDGPQDTLTFKVWKYSGLTTGNSPKITFLDANDGEIASEEFSGLSTSEPTNPNVIIDLKNNKYSGTKKLKFSAPSTFNQYFGEIKVSQQTYLTASTTSVTMSTVKACVQATGQFNISYSDLSRLQLSQTNENFTYEVWQGETKLNGFSNDCGDYGTYTVKFFYTPQTVGDYSNTVTISASGKEQVITLSGTANVPEREIVWDIPTGNTISATQSVDLTAYAQTDCESPAGSVYYTYSSTVDGAATIDGARITFNKAATITVTAHTVTSDMYEDATTVDKVWTVGKVGTQMKTLPTITSAITYGDNSSVVVAANDWIAEDVLNNDEIQGHINYVSPTSFAAAGAQDLIFNFTPDNIATYDVCQFTVPVTVLQKTSVATPSAANIVYGQKVRESELSNSGTEGTWTWNTENNEAVWDAGTHEGLAVHFTPANGNYTELDATVTLTVEKADPEVTAQATAITYGQAISASELSTATGDISGSWEWAVDEEQVLSVGDHVLKANFTSANANYNDLSNVDVTLTVNKAASEATPSAAAIKEGQKVSESVLTNSGTAGTWAWDAAVADNTPAAGTYNYTVHFTPTSSNYTELTTTVQLQVNVPVYNFTNGKGDGDWRNPENWEGGSVPYNNSDVIISGNMTIDDSRTVGNLTIEDGASVQVVVSGNLTVTGDSEDRVGYGDLVIANGGEVNVTGTLKVHDLVIASKSCTDGTSISGQLTGESNITNVDGDVYIDITLVEGALDDSQWYGFTVPFEVDAEHGVYRYVNGNVVGPLTWGNQYDIANYDSNKRYNTGKGWQYYRGTLNPGEFYYITLDGTYNVYRFKKKASSAISSGKTKSLKLYGANPASKDANWNPVGNPTLTYTITDYNGYVQIYQNGQSAYKAVLASEATFVVGCPFFIQAAAAGTLTLNVNEGAKNHLYAPARGEEKAFNISMQAETGGYADNIYLNTSDEADGTYRVGHDLLKAGTSKLVPQLWIAQGEDKLCVNEAELNNNNAYATLGLYAPKTGNYVLDIVDAPQDATLYLTYDGTVIWNLSESAYTLSLMKGTTANYGLQLVRESRNTTTGVEQVGSETQIQKFVHNGVLYINKDGVLYDAMGKKVK